MNQRRRAILIAGIVIGAIWLMAWIGHRLALNSRMTAEKVRQYVHSVDFGRLSGKERARALTELADKLNALPYDERRRVRMRREWEGWFPLMTESEKDQFIEATFPAGIKQMITAFERLPEDRRRRAIDESLRRLREAQAQDAEQAGQPPEAGGRTKEPPPISPELEQKIRTLGLKTFFAESSAQTKAEVAPLLEEIQRIIESGGRIHRRPFK